MPEQIDYKQCPCKVGQTLHALVKGDPGKFDVVLEVSDGTTKTRFKESQLVLGVDVLKPVAGRSYLAIYNVTFLEDAPIELHLTCDGSDTVWKEDGKAGQVMERGCYVYAQ